MSSPRLVLWLINAVQGWNHDRLRDALRDAAGITAVLGDREEIGANDHVTAMGRPAPNHGKTEYSPVGALMHEYGHVNPWRAPPPDKSNTFDEYFVPIPVKCLGDTDALEAVGVLPKNAALLAKVKDAYPEYYADPDAATYFEKYWTAGLSTDREVRMHSRPGLGYYRMLIEWNLRPGCSTDRHVLLGYSQGGIVGRFLAFLDAHVYQRDLVAGVVTVQSPNFGSAVARAETAARLEWTVVWIAQNLPHLVDGLISFLVAVAMPEEIGKLLKNVEKVARQDWPDFTEEKLKSGAPRTKYFRLAWLDDVLRNTIEAIRARIRAFGYVSAGQAEQGAQMLISVRKWISGVTTAGDAGAFAFVDLDPSRVMALDATLAIDKGKLSPEVHRTLHVINQYGHRHQMHAAVIGADPALEHLLDSMLPNEPWAKVVAGAIRWQLGAQLKEASVKYQAVMRETPIPNRPYYAEIVKAYDEGIIFQSKQVLEPRAHDCVIPSAYQRMYLPSVESNAELTGSGFLGHFYNDSGHAAGASGKDGPPTDEDLVTKLLKRVSARAAADVAAGTWK